MIDLTIKTICMIRHGETDWNAAGRIQGLEDTDLNQRGREQARKTGLYLQQWPWDAIVTSPLKRAKDTANIIARLNALGSVQAMDHFLERAYGACSGMTRQERNFHFPDGVIPGQEPLVALQQRTLQGLEVLRQMPDKHNILLIAHGGVINAILNVISHGKIGTGITSLHNAGITQIHYAHNRWDIVFYNSTQHLMPAHSSYQHTNRVGLTA